MTGYTDFLFLLFLFQICHSEESYSYNEMEKVILYVNKVGPYYNPHETYHYYTLPVCRPSFIEFKSLTLGEVLDGDKLAQSIYKINFKKNVRNVILCNMSLTKTDTDRLIRAIEEFYIFEFVIGNVPVTGFVGHLEETKILPHTHRALLYTHHEIKIYFAEKKVVNAIVQTTQNDPIDLLTLSHWPINITFTYSVSFLPSTMLNNDIYSNSLAHKLPHIHEIHWISIGNSLILVFLLLTFIMFIVSRVLRRDFARYNQQDSNDQEIEERGWKMVHNDVFRPPGCTVFFCAVVGTGCQLVTIVLGIVLMATLNMFSVHNHGVINITALFLYSLTSWVAGFVSCRLHKTLLNTVSLPHSSWVRVVNCSSAMFSLPLCLIWLLSNGISLLYGTTHATPAPTAILLGLVWLLLGYPLTVVGGMLGKRTEVRADTPGCRARHIAREVPPVVWYKSRPVCLILGGFLPFSSICIELHYIFATVWGREHYHLYGVLLIILVILLLVTVCVSISLTYFQLVNEDHRWWWGSLHLAAITAIFVFLYCVYHYVCRSRMSGLVQTVEYLGYSLLICYAFFLGLAATSFFASFFFVRFMYSSIKLD